ncbi:MAG TPA: hypothetical protein VGS80_00085 [Ktedonobacterales bacterium]|nr:hypothetical protein [Ktedonobacterales bacterium]
MTACKTPVVAAYRREDGYVREVKVWRHFRQLADTPDALSTAGP